MTYDEAKIEELRARLLGLIGRLPDPSCPSMVLPLSQSSDGGSGAFLVRADDGKRYWCKCVENPQSPRVPINEQLVGRLGRLTQAAVCNVSLIKIPPEFAGWEFRPGKKLAAGFAHASEAVESVVEMRALRHAKDDDNPRRLTTLKLLADLCCSGDPQWLCAVNEENRYYSHDHGHYFPCGPNWTMASLEIAKSAPPEWMGGAPVDESAVDEFMTRLEGISPDQIALAFSGLPTAWPITEEELVAVALFIEQRRVSMLARRAKEQRP